MSDPAPQPTFTPSQPLARPSVAPAPLQRSNYGIPPRQSAPMPTGPRTMDVSRPPTRPTPIASPAPAPAPAVAPEPATPPVQQAAPEPAPVAPTQPAPQPIFAATRQALEENNQQEAKKPSKFGWLRANGKFVLLGLAAVLLLAGVGRLVTAGNISGYTIAVGAVTVNDGKKTTIQFVADDGKLHHFTLGESKRGNIPGTAVQVAYQAGAADATVKQVSVVNSAHKLGVTVLLSGVVVALAASVLFFLAWRKKRAQRPPKSQAVPVTA